MSCDTEVNGEQSDTIHHDEYPSGFRLAAIVGALGIGHLPCIFGRHNHYHPLYPLSLKTSIVFKMLDGMALLYSFRWLRRNPFGARLSNTSPSSSSFSLVLSSLKLEV